MIFVVVLFLHRISLESVVHAAIRTKQVNEHNNQLYIVYQAVPMAHKESTLLSCIDIHELKQKKIMSFVFVAIDCT